MKPPTPQQSIRDVLEQIIVNVALNGSYTDAGQTVLSTGVVQSAQTQLLNIIEGLIGEEK